MSPDEAERLYAWADVLEDSNYYEILGVLELADTETIRDAFREFALAFHPDCLVEAPPELRNLATRVYRRGAEAYRVLQDPERRSRYDLALARGLLRMPQGDSNAPASPTGARGLEDLCRSPAARISAQRAETYISTGDFDAARRALQAAIAADEYENAELEERLEALDLVHFARGD